MKKTAILLFFTLLLMASACKKETQSERFLLLTAHTWTTDSLLAGGIDASGPGQLLEKFKGDIKFNEDGSGFFGQYDGTWRFVYNETSVVLESVDLPAPLTAFVPNLPAHHLR